MSTPTDPLSRRERQIMDIVYRLQRASVGQVRDAMEDAPSYSAVRALIGTLEDKGWLDHEQDGRSYIYFPTVPAEQASQSALKRVVAAFFGGSSVKAAMALLDLEDGVDSDELAALRARITAAEKEGR